MNESLYAERDIIALGHFYTQHVEAMTSEDLRSKSDIAAELAYRDSVIAKLQKQLAKAIVLTTNDKKALKILCNDNDLYAYISYDDEEENVIPNKFSIVLEKLGINLNPYNVD